MGKNAIAAYSGAGIGFAIGIMMGVAISPTVGVVVSAIASVLAVLLGLNEALFSDTKAIRIGSFGFALVAGAFIGMFVRNHNMLAPDLVDVRDRYEALGFERSEALEFVRYKEFEIIGENWMFRQPMLIGKDSEGAPVAMRPIASATSASVLLSAEVSLSSCRQLEGLQALSVSEIVNTFDMEGGAWARMAELGRQHLSDTDASWFLLAAQQHLCDASHPEVSDGDCSAIAAHLENEKFSAIRAGFSARGGALRSFAESAAASQLNDISKARALWILKTSVCDDDNSDAP